MSAALMGELKDPQRVVMLAFLTDDEKVMQKVG